MIYTTDTPGEEYFYNSVQMTRDGDSSDLERIRKIMQSYKSGQNLNPNTIHQLLQTLDMTPGLPLNFSQSMRNIVTILIDFNCTDNETYSNFHMLWCLYDVEEHSFAEDFCYWMVHKEKLCTSESHLMKAKNLFSHSKLKKRASFMKIFQRALWDANFDFLVILLRLGKCFEFPSEFKLKTETIAVLLVLRENATDHRDPTFRDRVNVACSLISSREWSVVDSRILDKAEVERKFQLDELSRRKSIIKFCINIFTRSIYNATLKDRYAKCLRLVFESVSEPTVSRLEVELYLRRMVRHRNFEEFVNRTSKLYVEFMPESLHPVSIRSLKHLCRNQVRKSLREANTLPEEIPPLELPRELIKYLKFDL